jgi:hypothetical protein
MTLGGFVIGVIFMAIGIAAVRYTDWFLRNFGDLGQMFGVINASWMSWKTFGLVFILVGFLIAFGLLQLFLNQTIGRLFLFGGL